jgi:hypothetical protein
MENISKDLKKILKISLPLLLIIIIGSYTYYKTKDLLKGVALEIHGVSDGESFDNPLVTLTGNAKNATELTMNGRKIFIDKSANFEEKILLIPGYNILAIKAEDKFGKKVEKDYQLTLIN